jgi:hypothetical protein
MHKKNPYVIERKSTGYYACDAKPDLLFDFKVPAILHPFSAATGSGFVVAALWRLSRDKVRIAISH